MMREDMHDEAVRVETIVVLDAVEVAVAEFREQFRQVARGESLNAARAETLAAQCAGLLRQIGSTRNTIRLSGATGGVH